MKGKDLSRTYNVSLSITVDAVDLSDAAQQFMDHIEFRRFDAIEGEIDIKDITMTHSHSPDNSCPDCKALFEDDNEY